MALLLSAASVPAELDHPRTILHIDIDCFYAQVEMIHNPELRNVPLGEFSLVQTPDPDPFVDITICFQYVHNHYFFRKVTKIVRVHAHVVDIKQFS